jgi:K+-transporting ATPase c subunit
MRLVLGVLSLLIVAAVVGMLAKTQLQSLRAPAAAERDKASAASAGADAAATPAQIQQRIKADVEKMMQAQPARGEPTQ